MVKRLNKLPLDNQRNGKFFENVELPREELLSKSSGILKSLPNGLVIRGLTDRIDCLEDVALWHHHEWLRTSGEAVDVTTFGQKLDQRIKLLRGHTAQPGIPFTLIAESSECVIGTVSVVQYRFAQSKAPSEWLTNLFILPEYRGQKIGSHLLGCAEILAQKYGTKILKLYTHDQTEFYQKRQWHVMGDARIQQKEVTILSKNLC